MVQGLLCIPHMKALVYSLILLSVLGNLEVGSFQAEASTVAEAIQQPEKRDCGATCLYKKGNEILSLQALAILDELKTFDSYVLRGSFQDLLQQVPFPYCSSVETATGAPGVQDSALACYRRYKVAKASELRELREGILRNDGMIAALTGSGSKGFRPLQIDLEDREAIAKTNKKLPQTTYVPEFKDLAEEFKRDERLRTFSDDTYIDWVRSLPSPPSKEEFVRIRKIPRYPELPLGEQLSVFEKDPQGNLVYDEKAYSDAMIAHQKRVSDTTEREAQAQLLRDKKSAVSIYRAEVRDGNLDKAAKALDPLGEKAFKKARFEMILPSLIAAKEISFGQQASGTRVPANQASLKETPSKDSQSREKAFATVNDSTVVAAAKAGVSTDNIVVPAPKAGDRDSFTQLDPKALEEAIKQLETDSR